MKDFILKSISRIDLVVWLAVILFFCGSATMFQGSIHMAFLGSAGIIFEMLLISISIEIIIEILKYSKGIGTLTGFITNGPEAICLIVGLAVGDIIFASSTPLGSNFMNPVLLIFAGIASGSFILLFKTDTLYTLATIAITATLAVCFYLLPPQAYIFWLLTALFLTIILFYIRPDDRKPGNSQGPQILSKFWLIPALLIVIIAGYFLDSMVTFAAKHSHAPKGVIGFLALATLTSWPEFKSSLTLLKRKMPKSALLNITVSNITNIWLAVIGIGFYVLTR